MIELSTADFNEAINSDIPVVVKYWMAGCEPCKLLAPVMDEVAEETKGIAFFSVSVDKSPGLAQRAKMRGAPTVIMYKNGNELARFSGFINKEAVINFINKNAAN